MSTITTTTTIIITTTTTHIDFGIGVFSWIKSSGVNRKFETLLESGRVERFENRVLTSQHWWKATNTLPLTTTSSWKRNTNNTISHNPTLTHYESDNTNNTMNHATQTLQTNQHKHHYVIQSTPLTNTTQTRQHKYYTQSCNTNHPQEHINNIKI